MCKKIVIIVIALLTQGCGDDCGKTTYRPEVGVGYVFMYDTSNNTSYPIVGAAVTVDNIYWTPGLYGANYSAAKENFYTDAEGRYQVRFVYKKCIIYPDGKTEEIFCNTYKFYSLGHYIIGFGENYISKNTQNNILILDTIKLYK